MCHTETVHYSCHTGISHVLRTPCALNLANPDCKKTFTDSYSSEECSDCKAHRKEEERRAQVERVSRRPAAMARSRARSGGGEEGFGMEEYEEEFFDLEEGDFAEFVEDWKKGKREEKKRANVAAKANRGGKGGGR